MAEQIREQRRLRLAHEQRQFRWASFMLITGTILIFAPQWSGFFLRISQLFDWINSFFNPFQWLLLGSVISVIYYLRVGHFLFEIAVSRAPDFKKIIFVLNPAGDRIERIIWLLFWPIVSILNMLTKLWILY